MAAKPSEKVGRGFCPFKNCGEPVTYRRSSGGKLTFKCDACDRSGYAEPGGSGHADCMSTLTQVVAAVRELLAPAPAESAPRQQQPSIADTTPPPPPAAKAGFSLGAL